MKINIHCLKFKMITSVIVLFLLFIAVSMINNVVASAIIIEKIENSVTSAVDQTDRYLSFLFTKGKDLGFVFSSNSNIEKLSSREIADEKNFYERYQTVGKLQTDINYYTEVNSEVESIYIYIPNINMVLAPGFRVFREDYIQSAKKEWLDMEPYTEAAYRWISHFNDREINGKNLMSIVCRADRLNIDKVETEVGICVNFDENEIFNIVRNLKITPNCMVYMYDSHGKIISSEDKSILNTSLLDTVNVDLGNMNMDYLTRIKLKGGYYRAVCKNNAVTGWNILILIPENELLAENNAYWRMMITIVFIMVIVLISIAARFIIMYIDKPVATLVSHMKELENGIFNKEIKGERQDEFGYLYKRYNEMIGSMSRLIRDLYQEKLLKREAQLKVLQSQINPHFLYNTLDTINWIARVNKVDKISKIVIALSNLYRVSFNKGMDCISVKELLLSIENYIYIQKLRYGDSFSYTISMNEAVGGCQVLNLILQPIVENAIIHGLGDREKGGMLKVKVVLEEAVIVFTVQDNGCGMSEEKLKLINMGLNHDGTTSNDSGMRNVHKRISLYYGEQYGVRVASSPGEGTAVTIRVPVYVERDCPSHHNNSLYSEGDTP